MSDNKKIIIAIDGVSSAGKSTFARLLAARLGYVFIDTGAMYRAVALYVLRGGDIDDDITIEFKYNSEREASDIYLNGENVEQAIRRAEVSLEASRIAKNPQVRKRLVAQQQAMGVKKGIVMDGRDIGTVVFPDAELKIFVTADPVVRAQRRYLELRERGEETTVEKVEQDVRKRDFDDQTREESPLRRADDAVVLDNSNMNIAEQLEWITPYLKKFEN